MTTLACPACAAPLAEASAPDAVLWLCDRCGGVWLDNAASVRVAEAALSRLALAHAHDVAQRAHALQGEGGYRAAPLVTTREGERHCPVCDAVLSLVLVPSSSVRVDACRDHGTWFDRDELVQVHTGFENERASLDARRRAISAIVRKFRPGK